MASFDSFHDFLNELRDLSDLGNLAERSGEILLRDEDWPSLVSDFIRDQPDEEFCRRVFKAHIPDVEPRIFMLHEEEDAFRVIVHVFDTERFDEHWQAGRLGAHHHHFSFSTRILRGSYHHWIFENDGELHSPELRLTGQAVCDAGQVYYMPWQRYHCVLSPDDGTMSLMVRGRVRVSRQGVGKDDTPEPDYDDAAVLGARKRVLSLLETAPRDVPGRRTDFRAPANVDTAST